MMRHFTALSFAIVAVVLSTVGTADAVLINVDFGYRGPYTGGAAAVPSLDGDWNNVATTVGATSGSDIALVDSQGNSTGVTLAYYADQVIQVTSVTWNLLMNDQIALNSGLNNKNLQVTLSGLMPWTYDLYVYGGSTNAYEKTIKLTVGGESLTLDSTDTNNTYIEGKNWDVFSGVVVDSSGTLVIDGENMRSGATAAFNGFQLIRNPGILTWTGGGADNLWSLAGNWNGLVPVPGDALVFGGTTRLTSVNDTPADTSFAGITFDESAGSFTLSGNGITLGGDLTSRSANSQTIDLDMNMPDTRVFSPLGGDVNVGGNISGGGGLGKVSSGTLILSGSNTYTGDTTVNGGRLVLDYSGASDTAAPLDNGKVWLRMGELVLQGKSSGFTTETMNRLYMGSYNGASNTLRLDANGGDGIQLTITDFFGAADNSSSSLISNLIDVSSSTANSVTVDGLSTYSAVYNGVLMHNVNGTGRANLVVRDSAGYGFATLSESTSGTVGRLTTGTALAAANTGENTNFFLTSGTVNRTANLAFSTITIDSTAGPVVLDMGANDLVMGSSGRAILVSGDNDVSITGSGKFSSQLMLYLHNYSSGTFTFGLDTQSSADSRLVVGGTGLTVWTGASTPKGGFDGVRISGGVFRPTTAQDWLTVGGGMTHVSVSGGAVLEIGEDLNGSTVGDLSNPVGSHGGGSNITFWGDSGLSAYGADRVAGFRTGGTGSLQSLTWGANNFLTNANSAGDGNYRLLLSSEHSNAKVTLQNNIALGSLVRTVDVADGSSEVDAVLDGVLSGSGGLMKTGAGTLSISGTNSYTGGTAVSSGTLLVDGDSSAATGPVAVNSGGTLGGTGHCRRGDVGQRRCAFLAPGASIGMLTFADQLSLQPGSTLVWEFLEAGDAGDDYDSITGPKLVLPETGTVNLSILALDGYELSAGDTFTLFHGDVYQGADESALTPGSDMTGLFAFDDNINWWGTWQVTANDPAFGLPGNLTLTAVPEPGVALLVISTLACGLLAWPRRNRR